MAAKLVNLRLMKATTSHDFANEAGGKEKAVFEDAGAMRDTAAVLVRYLRLSKAKCSRNRTSLITYAQISDVLNYRALCTAHLEDDCLGVTWGPRNLAGHRQSWNPDDAPTSQNHRPTSAEGSWDRQSLQKTIYFTFAAGIQGAKAVTWAQIANCQTGSYRFSPQSSAVIRLSCCGAIQQRCTNVNIRPIPESRQRTPARNGKFETIRGSRLPVFGREQ